MKKTIYIFIILVLCVLGIRLIYIKFNNLFLSDTSLILKREQARNIYSELKNSGIFNCNSNRWAFFPGNSNSVFIANSLTSHDYFFSLLEYFKTSNDDSRLYRPALSQSILFKEINLNHNKHYDTKNSKWTVVKNITDNMPKQLPVLMTANINPNILLQKMAGEKSKKRILNKPKSFLALFKRQSGIGICKNESFFIISSQSYFEKEICNFPKNTSFSYMQLKQFPHLKYLTQKGEVDVLFSKHSTQGDKSE